MSERYLKSSINWLPWVIAGEDAELEWMGLPVFGHEENRDVGQAHRWGLSIELEQLNPTQVFPTHDRLRLGKQREGKPKR